MAQKETILGNYLNFPRFPLDCESMDYIQENIKHLAIIAQIAGCDRLIINGCTGSPRSAGYVYVRTGNDLLGEILYFPGGSGARCSIKTDNINASANGETFNAAYTMRKLVSGTRTMRCIYLAAHLLPCLWSMTRHQQEKLSLRWPIPSINTTIPNKTATY